MEITIMYDKKIEKYAIPNDISNLNVFNIREFLMIKKNYDSSLYEVDIIRNGKKYFSIENNVEIKSFDNIIIDRLTNQARPFTGNRIVNTGTEVISGFFINGIPEGYMQVENSRGIVETGNVTNGAFNDIVRSVYPNGSEYFFNSELDINQFCKCKYVYDNGDIYDGKCLNLKPMGVGKVDFVNGDLYIGNWDYTKNGQNTEIGERGLMRYSNGDIYDGDWKLGMREGNGVFKSGKKFYKGNWHHDKKNGLGNQREGKESYDGEWLEDQLVKCLKYYYRNGDIYEGNFKIEGKITRYGFGKLTCKDGSTYSGNWNNDFPDGVGYFRSLDSTIKRFYQMGQLIKSIQLDQNGRPVK